MRLYIYSMGKQIEEFEPFGARHLGVFKVGNLVSWSVLGRTTGYKEYGYIVKIYNELKSTGRSFIFARVRKTNGSTENFMLHEIQKES